jgi:hypothetical protein
MAMDVDWVARGLAIGSFVVAGLTLWWSVYSKRRDWPRIEVEAKAWGPMEEHGEAEMLFVHSKIANQGASDENIQGAWFSWSSGIFRHPIRSWLRRSYRRLSADLLRAEGKELGLIPDDRWMILRNAQGDDLEIPFGLPAKSAAYLDMPVQYIPEDELRKEWEDGRPRTLLRLGPDTSGLGLALSRGDRVTLNIRTGTGKTLRTVVKYRGSVASTSDVGVT